MNQHTDPSFEGYGTLQGLEHLGRHITDPDGQPSGSPANFENLRGTRHPDGHAAARLAASADTISALQREFAGVGHFRESQEIEERPPEVEGDRPILIRRSTMEPAADPEPDADTGETKTVRRDRSRKR